jgi:ribonuclease G
MEAATEIARQLRLRDMGGIIVIDFIDQRSLENKRKIFEHLQNEMARDRARHTILPMSRFGLVQLTRQRVRPEVNIATDEACPSCNGTGKIQPSILLLDEVNNNVEYLIRKNKIKRLRISCHPFLAAFLKSGFFSIRMKWLLKYGQWIRIRSVTSLPFTHIRYYDENEEEIKLE